MSSAVRGSTPLALALAAMALGPGAAAAKGRSGRAAEARPGARVYALVELVEQPAADSSMVQLTPSGTAIPQLAVVRAEQTAFRRRVAAARLKGISEVCCMQRIVNGILYATNPAGVATLRRLPGAKAVHLVQVRELRGVAVPRRRSTTRTPALLVGASAVPG